MNKKTLEKLIQDRLAEIVAGPSVFWGQGPPGMIKSARAYLKTINLGGFENCNEDKFIKLLDKHAECLQKEFPQGARENWGAARKTINLFLRDVLYNKYLTKYFNGGVEKWLEIPLDSYTTKNIFKRVQNLPKWKSIKSLTPEMNKLYQKAATDYAKKIKTARVHLDLKFWRQKLISNNSIHLAP